MPQLHWVRFPLAMVGCVAGAVKVFLNGKAYFIKETAMSNVPKSYSASVEAILFEYSEQCIAAVESFCPCADSFYKSTHPQAKGMCVLSTPDGSVAVNGGGYIVKWADGSFGAYTAEEFKQVFTPSKQAE